MSSRPASVLRRSSRPSRPATPTTTPTASPSSPRSPRVVAKTVPSSNGTPASKSGGRQAAKPAVAAADSPSGKSSKRGTPAIARTASKNRSAKTVRYGYVDDAAVPDHILDDQKTRRAAAATANQEDLADEDQEALDMLGGKYGSASVRLSSRFASTGNGAAPAARPVHDQLALEQISRQSFGFRTPTKKGGMMDKVLSLSGGGSGSAGLAGSGSRPASSSATMTPTARRAVMNRAARAAETPKRGSNTPTPAVGETPIKRMALKARENEASTPSSTRRRVAKSVVKNLSNGNEDDDDSSGNDSGDDTTTDKDTDSEGEDIMAGKRQVRQFTVSPEKSKASKNPPPVPAAAKPKKAAAKWTNKENTDSFFEAHGTSRIVTSDRTIDRSSSKGLLTKHTPEELRAILREVPLRYADDVRALINGQKAQFKYWLLRLRNGFNLLCYGLGSKKSLLTSLQDYVQALEPASHFVVVNGFFPALNMKQILNTVSDVIREDEGGESGQETYPNLSDHCDAILRTLARTKETLYLVVHNMDGLALRADKAQAALAQLAAASPIVRLVASIDHINAPLLWNSDKISKFNFVWEDCTNFLPYSEETLNENSIFARQGACGNTQQMALNSLARVFETLTPNARAIYVIIAKYQIKAVADLEAAGSQEGNIYYQGISFKDLYQKSRKSFYINSDLTLRAQLTEFRDHKLIKERKGVDDGIDYLLIPLKNETLKEFLEQHDIE